jgi:hypothetical protein
MIMTNGFCVWSKQRIFLKIVFFFLVAETTFSVPQINGAVLVFIYVLCDASS